MNSYLDLSLYLVDQGEVTPATASTEWDGTDSILVAATSEAAALRVADAYDRGQAQANDLQWQGSTLACVYMRDPETGDYI